ncbi:MAG: DUF192 domain-containing protein [Granulosicoccus sp.]
MREILTLTDNMHRSGVDTAGFAVSNHYFNTRLCSANARRVANQWFFLTRLLPPVGGVRKTVSISRSGVPLLSAYVANTSLARLRGLFAFPPLAATEALVLQPCSAVHTFGLKQSLDVVFLDKRGEILKQVEMKPGSMSLCWGSNRVVEMKCGTVKRLHLQPGQHLDVESMVGRDE